MNVIGKNAEILWNLLQRQEYIEFKDLKKDTDFSDIELWAAIGWLIYEGRLSCVNKLRNGKSGIFLSIVE